MERLIFNMSNLFAQLGCASDVGSISRFIAGNRPMDAAVRLHEAAFWNPSQALFLHDATQQDADWAAVVDELNAKLH